MGRRYYYFNEPQSPFNFWCDSWEDDDPKLKDIIEHVDSTKPVSVTNNTSIDEVLAKLTDIATDKSMPTIVDYDYNPKVGVTTISWSDGTKTTVRAEQPRKADAYTGFVTAVAKKAMGNNNTINNEYDRWAVKKPEQKHKAEIENEKAQAEAKRREEKRRADKEQWLVRKEALKRKREYEAKKVAYEKYGVPMDFEGN